tara:strand:- start:920 stop:1201 length:282 start_codon:yes stop_codon:yes gene_type:complete
MIGEFMSESSSKLFSKLTEILSETAGAASGVKKEIEIIVKSQVEKILNDFEVVQRDEFEVIKEMLIKEKEKNEDLEKKLIELEKKIRKSKSTK